MRRACGSIRTYVVITDENQRNKNLWGTDLS
jgi:hypothetical protein